MPATPSRIGFITQQFRTATVEDTVTVPGKYGSLARKTTEPIPTYFDDILDTEEICIERFNLLSPDRRRFQVDLQGDDYVATIDYSQATPSVRLIDDERQADLSALIAGMSVDFEKQSTSLMIWGTGSSSGSSVVAIAIGRADEVDTALALDPASPPSLIDAPFTSLASDGWQADYASTPPSLNPLTAFNVTRAGFDDTGAATTFVDTVTVTQRVRQPYPNQGTLTSVTAAISDYIYADDVISGATNNSTIDSPKPICGWALPDYSVVGNSLTVQVVAFHRHARNGKPVACVTGTATDGTTTVTAISSTPVILGSGPGDRCAVIGYELTFDISSLTDNHLVTVNAKAYPHVGVAASVADSSLSAVSREFSPRFYHKHVSKAASPIYVYVNTSSGTDAAVDADGLSGGTPKVSTNPATAAANPFASYSGTNGAMKALVSASNLTGGNVDGCIIRFQGTMQMTVSAPSSGIVQSIGELIFEPDPSDGTANITFGSAVPNLRIGKIKMRNCKLNRTLGNQAFASHSHMVWENVTLDNNSQTPNVQTSATYINGLTILNPSANILSAASGSDRRLQRGIYTTGGIVQQLWLLLGCETSGGSLSTNGLHSESGVIIAFNKWFNRSGTSIPIDVGASGNNINGFANVQNLWEWSGSNTQPTIRISGDSQTSDVTHYIEQQNSYAGAWLQGRHNLLYDEGTGVSTHSLCAGRNNIFSSINVKGDVFINDGTHIGNWPVKYGVGFRNNFSQFTDANNEGTGSGSSFAQDYPGLNANFGTSTSVRHDPLFTDYQGATVGGSGAGNGDYSLQAGSPCLGEVSAEDEVFPYDIDGNARTSGSLGAYN